MATRLQRVLSAVFKKRSVERFGTFPFNFFSGFSKTAKSGEDVSYDLAKQLATYYACIRNISDDIAKLPIYFSSVNEQGNKTKLKTFPAAKLLKKPNKYSTAITLISSWVSDAVQKGNGYILIQRNSTTGKAEQLHFIPFEVVTPLITADHSLIYQLNYTTLNFVGTYLGSDMLHLKGLGRGILGDSMINYQVQSLGKALGLQNFQSEWFKSGSLTGLIEFEGVKDPVLLKTYFDMFISSYQSGGIAPMTGGAKFTKTGTTPAESQSSEANDQMKSEIASWFRMPLTKLQDQSQSNNNSLEQDNINYITDCLSSWIVKIEQEISSKLLSESDQEKIDVNIDESLILRGDSASQEKKFRIGFMTGALTPDEIRKELGYNTLDTEYSKTTYVPSNMIPGVEAVPFWQKQSTPPTQSQPGLGGQQQ